MDWSPWHMTSQICSGKDQVGNNRRVCHRTLRETKRAKTDQDVLEMPLDLTLVDSDTEKDNAVPGKNTENEPQERPGGSSGLIDNDENEVGGHGQRHLPSWPARLDSSRDIPLPPGLVAFDTGSTNARGRSPGRHSARGDVQPAAAATSATARENSLAPSTTTTVPAADLEQRFQQMELNVQKLLEHSMDKLATKISEGVASRFEQKLDSMETRFDSRVDGLEQRLAAVE
eukprot:5404603-Amphidinium_carterae.1